jgi:hypothetical protein
MKPYTIALLSIVAVASISVSVLLGPAFSTPMVVASTYDKQANPLELTGHVTMVARDSNGNIKSYHQSDNMILASGQNCIARELFDSDVAGTGVINCQGGVGADQFTWIAIGTDNTAAARENTALGAQILTRLQDTTPTVTLASAGGAGQVVLDATFTATGTVTVEESGLFDASSSGNMLARNTSPSVALVNQDTLTVTWTISLGS